MLSSCAAWREGIFGYGEIENDPQALHESARIDIEEGQADPPDESVAARGVRKLRRLERLYPDYGRREDLDYLMLVGRFSAGEVERGFAQTRAFLDRYPLSRQKELEDLLFGVGSELLQREEGWAPFHSDQEVGARVLEFVTQSFPGSSAVVPSSLRLLADWHYGRDEYGEALLAYSRLVDSQLPNQWTDLARYRIPLCLLRATEAADRDSRALWYAKEANLAQDDEGGTALAARLLRDYLEGPAPGGIQPAYTALAQRSLVLAERLLAEKERLMEHFYATIGNKKGELDHATRAIYHEQEAATLEATMPPLTDEELQASLPLFEAAS